MYHSRTTPVNVKKRACVATPNRITTIPAVRFRRKLIVDG
jgi:hypothetical protein